MNKTFKGLIKLTRFNEYVYFVTVTSLLGVAAAEGIFDGRMILLLAANWLAVGFAFMINDIEDAPDDALSSNKITRNPISAGLITPNTARKATFSVGFLSAVLFAFLGTVPFILGLISLLLGFIYSYRGIRLKTIALLDILSHCLMLAGLQYLSGYFTYQTRLHPNWIWPFLFVTSISIYGELYNEMRDIEGDRAAQLRHTAIFLGERATHLLMILMLTIGFISGIISFFVLDIIPSWVLVTTAFLAVLFMLPPLFNLRRGESSLAIQGSFQKPLERAVALGLLLQFLLPWLDNFLDLQLF